MPRVADSKGLANKRPARTTLPSEEQRRQAADANGGERAERLNGAGDLGERGIDDAGNLVERSDENDAARPAAGFVAFADILQRVEAVVKRHPPAAGDQRTDDRHGRRHLARRDAPACQDDRDVPRHQPRRSGDIELGYRTDIDFETRLRPDGDAVADIAHIDAPIGRHGAGIEKRQLEKTVFGSGPAQRDADDAIATLAVERNRSDGAVIDPHFEMAPRLISAHIVQRQHELARRHIGILRQRYEQVVVTAEIGEAQTVDEADIGKRHLGDETARSRHQARRGRRLAGSSLRRGRGRAMRNSGSRRRAGRRRRQRGRLRLQLRRRLRLQRRLRL